MSHWRSLCATMSRVVLEVCGTVLAYVVFIVLEKWQPSQYLMQRGFFCDDESILHPYHSDTVTIVELLTVAWIVPPGFIVLVECFRYACRNRGLNPHASFFHVSDTCSVPMLLIGIYRFAGTYLFGLGIVVSITDIGKFTIGRLRPNFLDVCRPDYSRINCTNADHIYVFVEDAWCTTNNMALLLDSRMSFPSGHSSISAFAAIYMSMYIQARWKWRVTYLLRHLVQALFVFTAFYVCLSRISDYRHHWSDVLSGAIIGVFIASLCAIYVVRMSRRKDQDQSLRNDPELVTTDEYSRRTPLTVAHSLSTLVEHGNQPTTSAHM